MAELTKTTSLMDAFGPPPVAIQPYLNIRIQEKDNIIYFLHSDVIARTESNFRNYHKAAEHICKKKYPGWTIEVKSIPAKEFETLDNERRENEIEEASKIQSEVVRLINQCASMSASDIHIDTSDDKAIIRVRVNGELSVLKSLPMEYSHKYISVIYNTMCDVAESMYTGTEFQDAVFARRALPRNLSGVRVACGPSMNGPFMVLRLLYTENIELIEGVHPLTQLGYNEEQVEILDTLATNPSGIILVAGPTGSGKSTTLKYIIKDAAKDPRIAFISIEDPPEYNIEGVRQMPISVRSADDDRDAAFGKSIRSALRSDPDRIMIGEIRDSASAIMAITCAQTGHQVWTTIHANGTFSILDRMLALMVGPKYSERQAISVLSDPSIINGLMFQRLVPRLCPDCKVPIKDAPERLKDLYWKSLINAFSEDYSVTDSITLGGDQEETRKKTREAIMENVYLVNPDREHKCENPRCKHGVVGRSVVSELVFTSQKVLDNVFHSGRGSIYAKRRWNFDNQKQTLQANARKLVISGELDPDHAINIVGLLEADLDERESD